MSVDPNGYPWTDPSRQGPHPMTHPLEELAALVEKAEGPDRELDAAIWWLVLGAHADTEEDLRPSFERNPATALDDWCGAGWRTELTWPFPHRYTRSIDAAMTLVPEGEEWSIHKVQYDNKGCPAAIVNLELPEVLAATPALALVAASLRARAAVGEK